MKLHYSLASTYSAEGITLGGTESGVTDIPEDTKGERAALRASLAHPSTVFRMKNGTISKVTGDEADEGEVITLEDDESETTDEGEVITLEDDESETTDEETEGEESEEVEGEEAAPAAKRSRARRS